METGPDTQGERNVAVETPDDAGRGAEPHLSLVANAPVRDETAGLRRTSIGLHDETRQHSVDALNQLRIDLVHLTDLEDSHAGSLDSEDANMARGLVLSIDERLRILGGTPIEAEEAIEDLTLIHDDSEDFVASHRILLDGARALAARAMEDGDYATVMLAARIIEHEERRIWGLADPASPDPYAQTD